MKKNFPWLQHIPLLKSSIESAKELVTPKTGLMSKLHPSVRLVISGYHENRELVCTTVRLAASVNVWRIARRQLSP